MKTLRIGEVAKRAGINASTIRYYERIGLLPPPARHNGKRRYNASIFEQLKIIQMAQMAGLTIREINHFLHQIPAHSTPQERWSAIAETKLAEIEEQMAQLERSKMILQQTANCTCQDLTICADFLPVL